MCERILRAKESCTWSHRLDVRGFEFQYEWILLKYIIYMICETNN